MVSQVSVVIPGNTNTLATAGPSPVRTDSNVHYQRMLNTFPIHVTMRRCTQAGIIAWFTFLTSTALFPRQHGLGLKVNLKCGPTRSEATVGKFEFERW